LNHELTVGFDLPLKKDYVLFIYMSRCIIAILEKIPFGFRWSEIKYLDQIMSIEAINRNNIQGSLWNRWDLHFHTPSSFEYLDKSVTNEQIITQLLKEQIKVVAITDHHVIDVDRIKSNKLFSGGNFGISKVR